MSNEGSIPPKRSAKQQKPSSFVPQAQPLGTGQGLPTLTGNSQRDITKSNEPTTGEDDLAMPKLLRAVAINQVQLDRQERQQRSLDHARETNAVTIRSRPRMIDSDKKQAHSPPFYIDDSSSDDESSAPEETPERPPRHKRPLSKKVLRDPPPEPIARKDRPKPASPIQRQATLPLPPPTAPHNTFPTDYKPVVPDYSAGADLDARENATKRSTNFCFTLNNWSPEDEVFLHGLTTAKYIVYGRETAPETGTKHLQGQLVWKAAKTWNATNKILGYRYHIEFTADLHASIRYCKKGGDFVEIGVAPATPVEKGQRGAKSGHLGGEHGHKGGQAGKELEQKRWKEIKDYAQQGNFDAICPKVYILHLRSLEAVHQRFIRSTRLDNSFGVHEWFYGETGSGKSRTARDLAPGAYIKMTNKWWDGYLNQDVVIIEEIDPTIGARPGMAGFFKTWADHYPFPAEVKGGSIVIRPKKIVVCSNYHPKEVFPHEQDYAPMMRRFRVTKFWKLDNEGNCDAAVEHEPGAPLDVPVPGVARTFNFPVPAPAPLPPIQPMGPQAPLPPMDFQIDEEESIPLDGSQESEVE